MSPTRFLAILASYSAACTRDDHRLSSLPTEVAAAALTEEGAGLTVSAVLAAVRSGNAVAVASAPALVPPGAPLAPFVEARLYAIGHVAMHDALNAIVPRFARYADAGPLDPSANAVAAVLTAAHDALIGGVPGAQASVDARDATEMAALGGAAGVLAGVALGARVAAAILARRANDGTAGGGVAPYMPGSAPHHQFTFPFQHARLRLLRHGRVCRRRRVGDHGDPVRRAVDRAVPRRTALRRIVERGRRADQRYLRDYNEVKALGCDVCTTLGAQTEIAKFWVESSPLGWNRIAGIVASQRRLDAWETARLLALVHMGEFDSYASNLESKYHYGSGARSQRSNWPRPTATRAHNPPSAGRWSPSRRRQSPTTPVRTPVRAARRPPSSRPSCRGSGRGSRPRVPRSPSSRAALPRSARRRERTPCRGSMWGTTSGGPPRLAWTRGDRSGAMSSPAACAA